MRVVADTLVKISAVGRRCCRRSSYIALQAAGQYLGDIGYPLPVSATQCPYWSQNGMCAGTRAD